MSSKQCSLAVEEIKEPSHEEVVINFKPELKVLINKQYTKNSDLQMDTKPVSIRGRITISF